MMSVFAYYGKEDVVKDIINYCVNNPNHLNFGDKIDISYCKLEYGFAYVSVLVDYKDFSTLCNFRDIAKLLREV